MFPRKDVAVHACATLHAVACVIAIRAGKAREGQALQTVGSTMPEPLDYFTAPTRAPRRPWTAEWIVIAICVVYVVFAAFGLLLFFAS
jgi:hypothetical protein